MRRTQKSEKGKGIFSRRKEEEEDLDGLLGLLSELKNEIPKTPSKEKEEYEWLDKLLQVPDIEKLLKLEMKRDEEDRRRRDKFHRTQEKLNYLEQREAEHRRRIEMDQEARVQAEKDHYERFPQDKMANQVEKGKKKKKHQSTSNPVLFRAGIGLRETTPMSSHSDRKYWSTQKIEADKRVLKLKEEAMRYEDDKRRELELQQELAELRILEKKNQQQRDIERKREGRQERTEKAQKRVAAAHEKKIREAEQAGLRRAQQLAKVDEDKSKREEFRAVRRDVIMEVITIPNLRNLIIDRLRQTGQANVGDYNRQPRSVRGSPRSLNNDDVTDFTEMTCTQQQEGDHDDDEQSPHTTELVKINPTTAAGSAVQAARCRQDPASSSNIYPSNIIPPSSSMVKGSFESSPFGMAAKLAEAAFAVAAASSQTPNLVFDDSAFRKAAAAAESGGMSEKTFQSEHRHVLEKQSFKPGPTLTPSPQRSRSAGQRSREGKKASHTKTRSRPQSAGRNSRKTTTPKQPQSQTIDFNTTRQEWKSDNLLNKPRKVPSTYSQKERESWHEVSPKPSIRSTSPKHSVKSVTSRGSPSVEGGRSRTPDCAEDIIPPVRLTEAGPHSSSSSRLVKKLLDLLEEEQAVQREVSSPQPSTEAKTAIYSPDFMSPSPTLQRPDPTTVGQRQLERIKAAMITSEGNPIVEESVKVRDIRGEIASARREGGR